MKDADESTTESRTLGAFIEQTLGWRDLLFATAGVRVDDNSAFGADFSAVYHPKFSLSWIASDETFLGKPGWLDLLRVRAAIGQSDVRPGTTDATQFFTGNTARVDAVESPGIVLNTLGNTQLKPERTTEVEAGFDLTLLANRLGLEFTYYTKDSRDALVQRVLPPSGGLIATTRFENLGKVRNSGMEALVTAQVVERPAFGWDLSLSGSTNKNTLVDLGDVNVPGGDLLKHGDVEAPDLIDEDANLIAQSAIQSSRNLWEQHSQWDRHASRQAPTQPEFHRRLEA